MLRRKKKDAQHEAAGFTEEAGVADRRRLTPTDVQEKVFRLSFRGYNEQDVDRFLDEVTEELASLHEENKRLRESADEGGGMASSEIVKEAERRAAETVRQAREYAARLMEDAGRRTSGGDAPMGAAPAPSSFLIRERDFLQRLASLIQEHAEAMKAHARGMKAPEAARAQELPKPQERAKAQEPVPPRPGPEQPVVAPPRPSSVESPAVSETTQAHEPFLDDWEGTFSSGPEDQSFSGTSDLFSERAEAKEGERSKEREEEPSLRELFWGEE
jgi:DivIVA domain-containing protein